MGIWYLSSIRSKELDETLRRGKGELGFQVFFLILVFDLLFAYSRM